MNVFKDFYYFIRFEFYLLFDDKFKRFHEKYMEMPINNTEFFNTKFSVRELDYLEVIQTRDTGEISPVLKHKLKENKLLTIKP